MTETTDLAACDPPRPPRDPPPPADRQPRWRGAHTAHEAHPPFAGDIAGFASLGADATTSSCSSPAAMVERRDARFHAARLRQSPPGTFPSSISHLMRPAAGHLMGGGRRSRRPPLDIGGPRGLAVVPDDFDWYWLIGDETALPAIGRFIEGPPSRLPVTDRGRHRRPARSVKHFADRRPTGRGLWAERERRAAADDAQKRRSPPCSTREPLALRRRLRLHRRRVRRRPRHPRPPGRARPSERPYQGGRLLEARPGRRACEQDRGLRPAVRIVRAQRLGPGAISSASCTASCEQRGACRTVIGLVFEKCGVVRWAS